MSTSVFGSITILKWSGFSHSNPLPGKAKFIHTYKCDGNPLPSFEGEPKTLELPDTDIDTLTDIIWKNLNTDNKVSLFVRRWKCYCIIH